MLGKLRAAAKDVGRRSPPPVWDCGMACAGLGAARDGRGGALAPKFGRETHFAIRLALRLKCASRGRGDGPALGLPCPLSSFRPLARRPFSPWVCFLFFYPLAQREGGGGKKIHRRAKRALRSDAAWFRPSCSGEWGGARGREFDLNFIDYFAPKRIKGGRGREFLGVFPIFFGDVCEKC